MAEAASLKWRVEEITVCPICLEEYNNPVSLPCLHAFCMHCMEQHCKDRSPGDDVPCPVCRSEFKMPPTGVNGLPHNFFIQTLIDAKSASAAGQEVFCEVCFEENDSKENIPVATTYCVDCNQKLCEQCCKPHRRMRGGPHQVQQLGEEVQVEIIRQSSSFCERHKNKPIEFYCFECKNNICTTCFIAEHRQHECREINEVAEEFLKQGDADLEPVLVRIAEMRKQTVRLATQKSSFLDQVSKTESDIEEKGEKVRDTIDRQVTEQKAELQNIMIRTLKEIESLSSKTELALTAMESFKAYFSELKAKGRPVDVTRAADSLHTRAVELLQTYTVSDFHVSQVTFTPMDLDELTTGSQNFIGCVDTDNLVDKLQLRTHKEKELEKKCEDLERNEKDLHEQLKQTLELAGNLKEQLKVSKENEDKVQNELKIVSERERAAQNNLKQLKDELKVLSDREQIERNKSRQLENELKTASDKKEILENKMSQLEEELKQALQREAEIKQQINQQIIESRGGARGHPDWPTTIYNNMGGSDDEETCQQLASGGGPTDDRYAEICRRSVVVDGSSRSFILSVSSYVRSTLPQFGTIERFVDIDILNCLVVFQDVSAADCCLNKGGGQFLTAMGMMSVTFARPTLETVKRYISMK